MKKNFVTITLFALTFILLVVTIYIGNLLKDTSVEAPTTIKKTKASSNTYSRTFSVDQSNNNNNELTDSPSVTSEQQSVDRPSPTINLTVTPAFPSPTEVILAYNSISISPTVSKSVSATSAVPISPTKSTQLPESGWIDSMATIIALSSFIIFISFIL